jgi:hypothetical protein
LSSYVRLLLAAPLVALACGGPPPKRARVAEPDPEPEIAARSSEWLYATREVNGSLPDECKAVAEWVEKEDKCRGALCVHGRNLARDWVARCTMAPPDQAAKVKALLAGFTKRMDVDPSHCAVNAEAVIKNGCGKDTTCLATTQEWATKCGSGEGSPLVLRILERTVERRGGGRLTLDPRSCAEVRKDMLKGVNCTDQFSCEEAAKAVALHRDRCEKDDAPTIAVASLEAAIIAAAQQPTMPIKAQLKRISPREVPAALADGMGVAISVCGERASDLAKYVTARKTCKSGTIVFAKAFKQPDGTAEVRLGNLDYPDDAVFTARFPTLAVEGEAELRDAQSLATFEAELGKVVAQSAQSPTAAAKSLGQVVVKFAPSIRRSAAFREALTAADGSLIPAMKELGKMKASAAAKRLTPVEMNGLIGRAQTRPFADMEADGTVVSGAGTRASELELNEVLPKSLEVYLGSMKTAMIVAKTRRIDKQTAQMAVQYGKGQATACATAEKKLSEAETSLLKCAFGVESCDEKRVAELTSVIDEARTTAEAARHRLDLVLTVSPAERDELTQLATTAGCLDPWW